MQIECIEPYPYGKLYDIPGIVVHREEVQSVGRDLFLGLGKDDVLFIDSTHVLRIDGDVPHLYLNVLPALGHGVLIHVHDIPFPFNVPYPAEKWVLGPEWPMYWNEAMVLQAFSASTGASRSCCRSRCCAISMKSSSWAPFRPIGRPARNRTRSARSGCGEWREVTRPGSSAGTHVVPAAHC
jgi:hypothetical protein